MTELVEAGEVIFFRLDNGEDIVAHAYKVPKDDFDDEHYILDMPLKVVYIAGANKSLSVSLMQWIFPKISHAKQCKIMTNKILTMSEPTENLIDFYYEMVDQLEKYRIEREAEEAKSKPILESLSQDDLVGSNYEDYQDFGDEDDFDLLSDLIEQVKNTKKTLH